MSDERTLQIQRQFASRASVYEEKAAWIADAGLLGRFVEMARVAPGAVLLDVCCGTGLVGEQFKGRVGRRVGLDITVEMLDKAKGRLDETVQGSADCLPFADASFDLVTCRQALHFVGAPEGVAREMFRVLRPGGQVIVGHRVPYGDADAAWWEGVNRSKQPLLRNILVARDLVDIVTDAGFVALETSDYFLEESIRRWVDSPEARAATDEVFAQYRSAPAEVMALRAIQILPDEVRDTWRWHLVSAFKPR